MFVVPLTILFLAGVLVANELDERGILIDGFVDEFTDLNTMTTPSEDIDEVTPPMMIIEKNEKDTTVTDADRFFNEVVFPEEESSSSDRRGVSIYRPIPLKNSIKQKSTGRTGWSTKRKRLIEKGRKEEGTQLIVPPLNHGSERKRPHSAEKRAKKVKTRKSDQVTDNRLDELSDRIKPIELAGAVNVSRALLEHHRNGQLNDSISLGDSRLRPPSDELRGFRVQSQSSRQRVLRVSRTDERTESKKKNRKINIMKYPIDNMKELIVKQNKKKVEKMMKKPSRQIQVKSADRRYEIPRTDAPQLFGRSGSDSLLQSPHHSHQLFLRSLKPYHLHYTPLSTSSFVHFSPRPLRIAPLRTTQRQSSARSRTRMDRLNARDVPLRIRYLANPNLRRRIHDAERINTPRTRRYS